MTNQEHISPSASHDRPHNSEPPQSSRCYLLKFPEQVLLAVADLAVRDLIPSTKDFNPFIDMPDMPTFDRGCRRLANAALLHVCIQTRHVAMPVVGAVMEDLHREVTTEKAFWEEVAGAFEVKKGEGRWANPDYVNARASLRLENELFVWHRYSQIVWDVHLGREKTYTVMDSRSPKDAIKPTPSRLLDLPKELRLII